VSGGRREVRRAAASGPPLSTVHTEEGNILLNKRLRRRAFAVATTMALGVGLIAGLAPNPGVASSHREAPLVSADPQIDVTDVYAFVSPDKPGKVTLISSWIPFEEPAGGPNFYPWAAGVNYDIKIDNNHDAKPDITYRWIFTDQRRGGGNSFLYNNGPVTSLNDSNLLFYQTYDLQRIVPGKAPVSAATVSTSTAWSASSPSATSSPRRSPRSSTSSPVSAARSCARSTCGR